MGLTSNHSTSMYKQSFGVFLTLAPEPKMDTENEQMNKGTNVKIVNILFISFNNTHTV